jgi:hypothetical protein
MRIDKGWHDIALLVGGAAKSPRRRLEGAPTLVYF